MDGNYAEWEICMEADLVDKGLWEYVFTEMMKPEGDTNSAKKAIAEHEMKLRQARARMIRRVTAGQLPHMRDPDPRKVWAELRRVHRAGGFGSKLAMQCRFINAKMKQDDFQETAESMASWIGRVKAMHFELDAVVVDVTDEDVILVLTNGLPTTYSQFIITLDGTYPEDITLENIIVRLANEEGQQDIDIVKKEEEKVRLGESALAATRDTAATQKSPVSIVERRGIFVLNVQKGRTKRSRLQLLLSLWMSHLHFNFFYFWNASLEEEC